MATKFNNDGHKWKWYCALCGFDRNNYLTHRCNHGHEHYKRVFIKAPSITKLIQIDKALGEKMKRLALLSLVFMLVMTACRTTAPSVTSVQKDSVAVSETTSYRDTSVYSTADSASIITEVWMPGTSGEDFPALNLNLSPLTFKSKSATVKVSITKGILQADCNCDSTELKLKIAERRIETLRQLSRTDTITVEKKFTPWYMQMLAGIGACSAFGVLIFFIIKSFKPI